MYVGRLFCATFVPFDTGWMDFFRERYATILTPVPYALGLLPSGSTSHFIALICAGVHCLSLSSSPSSEDGQVTVCPGTPVTLTCTASQIEILTWREEPDEELRSFFADDYESEERRVIERGPYTLTLVAVDNVSGTIADFTSTLEVMVDDIEDGTTIACDTYTNEDHLTISKKSKALL